MFWSMFKKRKILTNFINFSLIIYLSVKSNPQSIKFWVLFLHQKLNPKPISYFLKSLNFRKFGSQFILKNNNLFLGIFFPMYLPVF